MEKPQTSTQMETVSDRRSKIATQMAQRAISISRRTRVVDFGTAENPQRYTVLTHPLISKRPETI